MERSARRQDNRLTTKCNKRPAAASHKYLGLRPGGGMPLQSRMCLTAGPGWTPWRSAAPSISWASLQPSPGQDVGGRSVCRGQMGERTETRPDTLWLSPLQQQSAGQAGRCLSVVPGLGRPLGSSEKEAIMQQPVMALWLKRRVAAKLLLSWEKNWLWEQFSIWSPISGSCLCYFQTARLFRLRGLAFV